MELEALDSVSSQQLAAFIETRLGKKFAWNEGIGEGVTSYLGAYSKWDYTKKAMDQCGRSGSGPAWTNSTTSPQP